MLKLKLQCFDHLMWRTDAFEKTLMLGKIEGGRRRGRRRMRWLDGITDSVDVNLSRLGAGGGEGSLLCCSPWGRKESDKTERQLKGDVTYPLNAMIPVGGDYFLPCPTLSGLAMWLTLASWVSGSDTGWAWADIFRGIVRFCHCSVLSLVRMASLRCALIPGSQNKEDNGSRAWPVTRVRNKPESLRFFCCCVSVVISQHNLPQLTNV